MTCPAYLRRDGWVVKYDLRCSKRVGHKGKHEAPIPDPLIAQLQPDPAPSRAWIAWI